MKRYTLFVILIIFAISACNNNSGGVTGGEPTTNDGLAPAITVENSPQLRDTMKFSVQQEYVFNFQIEDDQTERYLSVSKLQNGLLFFQGKIINDTKTDISGIKDGQLTFRALDPEEFSFILSVEDAQGLTTSAVIDLNVLDNIIPIARMELEQTDDAAPYQIAIDATPSYDQDSRWGGDVMAYEYTVDNFYTVETVRSKLQYIFPQAGTYRIGLRVKDNDGDWSEELVKQISIK